jgi:Domain of unknown function (DUF1735)
MKKKLYFLSTLLLTAAVLSLSSCLKDNRYVDFSKGTPIVEFNLGGSAYFGPDAITESGDTVVKQFAVSIASTTLPTTATTVNLAIDNSITTSYVAANPNINYLAFPAGSFVFNNTSVTIPAGQRVAIVSVTFYKDKFDASLSYMLPIKIVSASGGASLISANMAIHYFHYIGNDFAGSFEHYFDRWPVPDTTGTKDNNHVDEGQITFLPIDPSTFSVQSAYYTGIPYTVSFTKTGNGATATYSNFAVTFTADDIQTYFTAPGGGVVLGNAPIFDPPTDPTKQYTFAQALKLFRFFYTTGTRAVIDTYVKQ